MRLRLRRILTGLCLWAWVTTAPDAHAQRILYDGKADSTAQAAAAAAKQVTSGTLFETMLKNVDAQAKIEADTEMALMEQVMRAKMNACLVWHDAAAVPARSLAPGHMLAGNCRGSVRCMLESLKASLIDSQPASGVTADAISKRLEAIKAK